MNNPDAHEGLLAIARAISSGLPVDWGSADSNVSDATMRAIVRELKVVAEIAELHGTLGPPDADVSVWDSIAQSSGAAEEPTATAVEEARLPAWGPLLLVERVGRGAFGEIYRAWDRRLQRQVALKLLRPRAGDERDSVGASVIEEGRLLARVRHANVVSVYGTDRIDGRVGVWMEFVRGRTLERVLRDQGPFSSHEATLVGRDLCRALSAVHHAGLLHRDVKAQNVMREDGGRIVLMDFGTGRESDEADRVTGSDFAGTPLYMAPEVLALKPAAVASDLYSLGVLLFHLVTGSYPVEGRTLREVRRAHADESRPSLRDRRPEIDAAFAKVVEHALDPDPSRRYGSAAEMESALAACVRPRSAHRVAWIAAAIVIVLAGAGIGVWKWRQPSAAARLGFQPRDVVLITRFENRTGEPVFDGAVEYALERELSNSDVIRLVSGERIDDALALMKRPLDTIVDRKIGREVAVRDGHIKVLLAGRIEKFGPSYVLTAQLVDPADDAVVATLTEEASGPGEVRAALRREAASVRLSLGERREHISGTNQQIEPATTRSLKAFQLYQESYQLGRRNR